MLYVSPGVGTRHLESLENPDGPNLGKYVFIYVYKDHMCVGKTAGKWRKCESYFGASTRGSQLGRAMNCVDRLRASADERVLSGRRAVVIA